MKVIDDTFDWEAYDEAPERSKVIPASSCVDEVIDLFYGPEDVRGDYMPWQKSHDKLRLRKREVTIYAGINGHGKSLITSQIALGLQRQDERVLLCSFEMRPAQTMQRMARQAASTDSPSVAYIHAFHRWTDRRLWIYDHFGTCHARKVLGVCRYAARDLGVRHIFVDSLMKCVEGTDDYNGQKAFVGELCTLALSSDVHVHLVAHARKGGNETDAIDKFDIRGAGEIADQVDNVVLVQRNKRKEAQTAKGNPDDSHDCFLTIAKQRHGGYEGTLGLYFDPKAQAFIEKSGGNASPLMLDMTERQPGEEG